MVNRVFNIQPKAAYDASLEALKKVGALNIEEKFQDGIIEASLKSSFLSWGENIYIRIIQIHSEQTKVEVESLSKAQIIDWGINSNNEYKIIEEITKILYNK